MATGSHSLRGGPRPRAAKPRRISFDEHLPLDHRLSRIYRVGAGLMGLVLLAFGVFGLIDKVGFFDTHGDTVAGLNTNGALSVLSIVVGLLLFVGMVIGGNFASTLNTVLAIAFLLSGFVNLALLPTNFNFLAFGIQNVLFSFVFGIVLMIFGMWGRVSATLGHDNPYWRARHPEEAAREARTHAHARAEALRKALNEGASPEEIARQCYSPTGGLFPAGLSPGGRPDGGRVLPGGHPELGPAPGHPESRPESGPGPGHPSPAVGGAVGPRRLLRRGRWRSRRRSGGGPG